MTARIRTPRALIADDQADVLEALRLLLKSEDYRTESVTSPAAVLERLRTQEYDLVLMDLNYARDTTSGQEGMDLLTQIRAFDSNLPVVVMTAWGSIDLAVEAMRRGVGDFVQKPWENSRLLATLRIQVEKGRRLRRASRYEAEKKSIADLAGSIDPEFLFEPVAERLHNILESSSVLVLTRDWHDRTFSVTARTGTCDLDVAGLRLEAGSLQTLSDPIPIIESGLSRHQIGILENAGVEIIVPMRSKDEMLAVLAVGRRLEGEQYDGEDLRFLSEVVEHVVSGIHEAQTRKQEQDFREASQIQQRLLPQDMPRIPGYELAGAWQAARVVGGDYYDVFRVGDSSIAMCIGDVVGKGMPAALLMSNLQAAVRATASDRMGPSELCARINHVICGNIAVGKFITFFYALLDPVANRLTYCNAGHCPPILLRRDGSLIRLSEGGAVLGAFDAWQYDEGQIGIEPGDRILLFTDGVSEAGDFFREREVEGDAQELGEQRLLKLIGISQSLSSTELKDKILGLVAEVSGGDLQDDATLIVVSATFASSARENGG
jgi:serine phosphatase RsbU (regulator of sigma subunit)/FixJ family two-component response regulator